MDKEAMKLLIWESLSKKLGSGYRISIREVLKTNLKLDALILLMDGKNCTPAIYLDPFYGELEKGATVDDVTDGILQLYLCNGADIPDLDASPILDFGYVGPRLYVGLINRHLNRELLEDTPHSLFLDDLAVVARCHVDIDGPASFLVHDNFLRLWKIDRETLLSTAMRNTREMSMPDIRSMEEVLRELTGWPAGHVIPFPMWVMSNRDRQMGAATALFDDVLKGFAETHGSFYTIFSSVHEALLIPAGWEPDVDLLTQINQEVNAAQVRQDEILGTHAYFYDREKGFVL